MDPNPSTHLAHGIHLLSLFLLQASNLVFQQSTVVRVNFVSRLSYTQIYLLLRNVSLDSGQSLSCIFELWEKSVSQVRRVNLRLGGSRRRGGNRRHDAISVDRGEKGVIALPRLRQFRSRRKRLAVLTKILRCL